MGSTIKKILKSLGPNAVTHVYDFIKNNNKFLKDISLGSQLNSIGNYVHLKYQGDYSRLNNYNAEYLFTEYEEYVSEFRKKYNTKNFIEKNKIILDNRIDNIGFYWIDIEKEYCIESMIRMEDCGRTNYGSTTLELREQKIDSNESHMIVVYEINSCDIKQIKGKRNEKPHEKYWQRLYDLLVKSDYEFNRYTPSYKPENDLLISDLPINLQIEIYKRHRNLSKNQTLI
jgi:hypothetical protein